MKRLLLALSLLFAGATAHADLLLEPYLGYHTGKWEIGTTDTDMSGVSFGARIGYQSMGFMIGADYMTGMWKDKETSGANDVTPADLGLFVGYEFPIALRVYGTLSPEALNPALKFKDSGGTDKLTGQTVKLGVGFTFMPMLAVNLEVIQGTYNELDGVKFTPNMKTMMYGLSVSLPLTF